MCYCRVVYERVGYHFVGSIRGYIAKESTVMLLYRSSFMGNHHPWPEMVETVDLDLGNCLRVRRSSPESQVEMSINIVGTFLFSHTWGIIYHIVATVHHMFLKTFPLALLLFLSRLVCVPEFSTF